MDKQIIIDGVDVAKCRCFISEWDFNNCGHICKGTECKYKRLWYKKQLNRKERECERLKWYLKEIRDDELKTLDIELDEYETHCIDTEYTNIISLVEEALEERSPEDCRYKKDK